jgi:hypothetical protein
MKALKARLKTAVLNSPSSTLPTNCPKNYSRFFSNKKLM